MFIILNCMKNRHFLNLIVFLAVILVFIVGCEVVKEEPTMEASEEIVDTGALVVESSPGLAQVYIGEEYNGDTPLTLYNLPVGQYEITIRKEGYADFKKIITIKVGRTEELSAALAPVAEESKSQSELEEEQKKQDTQRAASQLNKINHTTFAMYYDFEKAQFSELRTDKSDLFSRKYDTYVHFTALTPAKINVISKPIKEVAAEDCIFADIGVASLFSGQTLCVKTQEGTVVALGFETNLDELEWTSFS